MRIQTTTFLAALLLTTAAAHGEIVSSSATHYELHFEATSSLSPDALWERLTHPERWWHPDHTYSGDSANLSLDPTAGGLWREQWAGGSVAHGQVVLVEPKKTLRMEAPFGPLQGVGAYVIWTVTIVPGDNGGTHVVFEETATGPPSAGLSELAEAVDFVKAEAIRRLTESAR